MGQSSLKKKKFLPFSPSSVLASSLSIIDIWGYVSSVVLPLIT